MDGSGSLPWGNSDLPVYASPVTKASRPCASCAAALVWIIGAFEPCETWYYAFYSSTTSEHLGCIGRTSAIWSFVRLMKPLVFLARVRLSCELCTVETRLYLIDEQVGRALQSEIFNLLSSLMSSWRYSIFNNWRYSNCCRYVLALGLRPSESLRLCGLCWPEDGQRRPAHLA